MIFYVNYLSSNLLPQASSLSRTWHTYFKISCGRSSSIFELPARMLKRPPVRLRNRSVDAPYQGSCSMYPKQIVSKKELRTVCGIPYSPQHIARLEAAGQFPKRIRLGQNRVAWLLSEVEEWLDVRIANREASVNR